MSPQTLTPAASAGVTQILTDDNFLDLVILMASLSSVVVFIAPAFNRISTFFKS
jgi:hypothetical protein